MADVTLILGRLQDGDAGAADQLLLIVYEELRRLAAQKLANERQGQTLQPTALVHEVYLRLLGRTEPDWKGRGHFFASAAEAMRRILVENARRKARLKHGGDWHRVELDSADAVAEQSAPQLLALDEVLNRFQDQDPVKADLVKLRYFAGLTLEQAAKALGISRASAERYWAYARAWLYAQLTESDEDAPKN